MFTSAHLAGFEIQFEQYLLQHASPDAAHDLAHIHRVVKNARQLAATEDADLMIVVPAAWLHDCVIVPKDSPLRKQASRLAARAALQLLEKIAYPSAYHVAISHAIETHSFSANIPPQTLEAKVVQDADRLEAIGAIGVARCLMLGGAMGQRLYDPEEPFPLTRTADDTVNVIDHFYCKLLHLEGMMQTEAGRAEAHQRTRFMQVFLEQLREEIGVRR